MKTGAGMWKICFLRSSRIEAFLRGITGGALKLYICLFYFGAMAIKKLPHRLLV